MGKEQWRDMIRIMLSRILGEKRINQAELARKTGIRPNTINALYHGYAKRVTFEQIDKICEALDCELDELFVREPDGPDQPRPSS